MPRATIPALPALPLSGIFAINKPSGPTSMSLLTRLKPLFSRSRLFVPEAELDTPQKKSKYPGPTPVDGKKQKRKPNWKKISRQYVKMGSGGTLDPLADGVLVIGIGSATKELGQFIECTKSYRTTGLLGCETDSYDSEGAVTRLALWRHASRAMLAEKLEQFRGSILQIPPIYSALKVEGKPLYEYAREGIPLPRPIEARPVRIDHIALTSFIPSIPLSGSGDEPPELGHRYSFPAKRLSAEQQAERLKVLRLVNQGQESARVQEALLPITPDPLSALPTSSDHVTQLPQPFVGGSEENSVKVEEKVGEIEEIPPTFELEMTVSSGTYVRSIVHDLAIAVGSAAHVVSLTRTRQGPFVLPSYVAIKAREDVTRSIGEAVTEEMRPLDCVDWAVLEDALRKLEAGEEMEVDEDGWANWELEILQKWPDQSVLKMASSK